MLVVIGIILIVWFTLRQDNKTQKRLKDLEDKLK